MNRRNVRIINTFCIFAAIIIGAGSSVLFSGESHLEKTSKEAISLISTNEVYGIYLALEKFYAATVFGTNDHSRIDYRYAYNNWKDAIDKKQQMTQPYLDRIEAARAQRIGMRNKGYQLALGFAGISIMGWSLLFVTRPEDR